jgi:hypothetical protein
MTLLQTEVSLLTVILQFNQMRNALIASHMEKVTCVLSSIPAHSTDTSSRQAATSLNSHLSNTLGNTGN